MTYLEMLQDPRPSNALVRAIKALLDAPTREEARAVFTREQALLVSDAALQFMQQTYRESFFSGNPDDLFGEGEGSYSATYLLYHLKLLETASSHGIARAWEIADGMVAAFGGSREKIRHLPGDRFDQMLRGEL